jgi:hypothetical protein
MTDATPCALIVGARAKDGGQPCRHPHDEHVRYRNGAFDYYVCRPCREAGIKWTVDYAQGVTGADHWPTGPRSAPPRRRARARAE